MNRIILFLATACPLLAWAAAPAKPFELRDGDRVVFLGDTLMEREKDFGYIELMMTLRFPDRNVTFRNLGWSADTPVGISRVSFDWPKGEGEMFRVLMEQVRQSQPTVVVLGYGMASSLEDAAASEMEGRAIKDGTLPRPKYIMNGTPRLAKFVTDYNKLIDAILELNKETRFILLSPIRHEKLPPPLPDPARHNEFLASYTKVIEGIAEKRGFNFVNLSGVSTAVDLLAQVQNGRPNPPQFATDNGIHLNSFGYRQVAATVSKDLAWPAPTLTGNEDLRVAIVAKNELFFNRWRPENSTYLFLFRKHEQGKNAQEIPKFDPLIAAEEEKIGKLRHEPARKRVVEGVGLKPKQIAVTEHPATPFKPQGPVHFQLADTNLEVTLWAENPLLAKPIAMNWDARGRLWIASSSVYPQIEPGQAQDDKILILEDTNGDGKADKTTVFADALLIPTGVEPGDGGCYVGQSTELLHFKDTDGDGIADQKRVVLSGFGTEDTHHILHTLRWGPDGQLYMNQSIYIHSHIETPHGVVRLNSGGTLALRPDTMELGVTMKGLVNGWGHVWDDFGQEFQTDGAGGAPPNGLFWDIPQAMFTTYEGARRILGSISPGSYPKFCSLELIKSERFPKEWQGNAITCDFRANRVVRFEITEQGAGYTSKQYEFLRTTNITFRPIDVKIGPDGALYIADWSNPIIQHGEVDFRDPRRDREHGRIWRVGYKGGKDVKAVELVKATNKELLDQLVSPNALNRKQAQRVFIERARSDSKAKSQAEEDLTNWGITTIWMGEQRVVPHLGWFQALDVRNEVFDNVIFSDHPGSDPRVVAGATRVLATLVGNTPGLPSLAKPRLNVTEQINPRIGLTPMDLLAKRITNAHPRVRIEALRALARIPTARSAELALSVLDDGDRGRPARTGQRPADQPERAGNEQNIPSSTRAGAIGGTPMAATGTVALPALDPWLEYALWLTINDLAEPWAAAVESGAWKIEGREKQLQYALKAIEPRIATRLMAKLVGNSPLPRDGSGGMVELIGQAGTSLQMRFLFDQVLNNGFNDEGAVRALNSLIEAARLRNVRPSGDPAMISRLLDSPNDNIRAAAAKVVGGWKLAALTPELNKLANDASSSANLRQAAIEGLREVGGGQAVTSLRTLTKDGNDSVRRAAAAALASADLNRSMPQILEVVSVTTKEDDALALWRSLLAVKGSSAALTKALGNTTLPEPVARAAVRAAREGGRNDPNLVLALNKAGGLSDASAGLTDEEIHAIAYEVTKGNPANGEKIYRNKQLGCVLCHSIGGAGGKVGPDITSLGASTPLADYIVEAVLLPNKRVKEGFNSVQISTKDGEDLAGNLVREDTEQVILRDATAKEISVPKRNIQSRKMGGSLMPAGLLDFITPQERLDLYSFLARLGKPGEYDATKQNVARVWRLNTKVGTVNADEMLKSDLRGKDWFPVYATVGGTLPRSDVMAELDGKDTTVWLASRFQTTKAGPTKFKVTGTASPKAWIDGKPIGGDSDLTVDLPAGAHTFFIKVTTSDIAQGLKLESSDATFLAE